MEFFSRSFRSLLAMALLAAFAGFADELKLRAQLVWGTDNSKPANKDYKELESKAREKLRQYRWKNYFVVKEETVAAQPKPSKRTELSDKCAIAVKDLGNGNIEITLFELKKGAEPKLVKTIQHPIAALKKGEYVGLAGDAKENWDDAWFVILSVAPEK